MSNVMRFGVYFKSSLIDPRCCDNDALPSSTVLTGWRPLSTSLTCVLDVNGHNTGYVHVQTLEQYTFANGQPTGNVKPNVNGDVDYVSDYLNTSMCATPQTNPANVPVYGYNGCSGILVVELIKSDDASVNYSFDVAPGTSYTGSILAGNYDVHMHVSQNQPAAPAPALNIIQIVNSLTQVVASESITGFAVVAAPLNLSARPTTQPLN